MRKGKERTQGSPPAPLEKEPFSLRPVGNKRVKTKATEKKGGEAFSGAGEQGEKNKRPPKAAGKKGISSDLAKGGDENERGRKT